jgi:hypothetical protein
MLFFWFNNDNNDSDNYNDDDDDPYFQRPTDFNVINWICFRNPGEASWVTSFTINWEGSVSKMSGAKMSCFEGQRMFTAIGDFCFMGLFKVGECIWFLIIFLVLFQNSDTFTGWADSSEENPSTVLLMTYFSNCPPFNVTYADLQAQALCSVINSEQLKYVVCIYSHSLQWQASKTLIIIKGVNES